MPEMFTRLDLEAYMEEALDAHEMTRIEAALRNDPTLVARMMELGRQREEGQHSLGAIWRRHRASCPNRQTLGGFLLEALAPEEADYVYFHVTEIGCRACQANLKDLESLQASDSPPVQTRRKRYFETSAGLLNRAKG